MVVNTETGVDVESTLSTLPMHFCLFSKYREFKPCFNTLAKRNGPRSQATKQQNTTSAFRRLSAEDEQKENRFEVHMLNAFKKTY